MGLDDTSGGIGNGVIWQVSFGVNLPCVVGLGYWVYDVRFTWVYASVARDDGEGIMFDVPI
jgi:hypothetical protein